MKTVQEVWLEQQRRVAAVVAETRQRLAQESIVVRRFEPDSPGSITSPFEAPTARPSQIADTKGAGRGNSGIHMTPAPQRQAQRQPATPAPFCPPTQENTLRARIFDGIGSLGLIIFYVMVGILALSYLSVFGDLASALLRLFGVVLEKVL